MTGQRHWFPTACETLGVLAVLAGLANLINVFFSIGYLPAPFVFDVGDTFMDWFNTAYWAHNPGAYDVWQTIYLPLSFVVTGLLGNPRCYGGGVHPYDARDCDVAGIVVILLTYVACIVVSAIALYRTDRRTALPRSVAIAVGGPLLFALERGNLIMITYIPFVLLYGGIARSRKAVAAASAFLVNMKVYLLFPVFAFAIKRKWRTLELCGLAALGLYLLTLVIVGDGTPFELMRNLKTWFSMRETQAIWDDVLYSTTYAPYLLFDVRQYPVRDYLNQQFVDAAKTFIQVELVLSRGVAILCILSAWFYPRAVSLHRLVFFILMQSFIAQNPGGYAMMLIIFLVFLEKFENLGTALAIVCAYLICIPTDYTLSVIAQVARDSWLSGKWVVSLYTLPLGAIVRPGILLVMLWSLAIDTLLKLHRAVKAGPPTLGLVGRGSPMHREALVAASAH